MKTELTSAWNEAEALYIENEKLKKEIKNLKSDLEYADDLVQERANKIQELKKEVTCKTKCIYFLLILIGIFFLVFGSCEAQKAVPVSNAQVSTSTTSLEN